MAGKHEIPKHSCLKQLLLLPFAIVVLIGWGLVELFWSVYEWIWNRKN